MGAYSRLAAYSNKYDTSVQSFVILSVYRYNRSFCACGMLVYSKADPTSYGRIGIIILSVHVGC